MKKGLIFFNERIFIMILVFLLSINFVSSEGKWLDYTNNSYWQCQANCIGWDGNVWTEDGPGMAVVKEGGSTWAEGFKPSKLRVTYTGNGSSAIIGLGLLSGGIEFGSGSILSAEELNLNVTSDIERVNLYSTNTVSMIEFFEESSAIKPVGNEFQVNDDTTYDKVWSDVSMDSYGNIAVVWRDSGLSPGVGQDGDWIGIFAKRYDNLGNELAPPLGEQGNGAGNEFQVNAYTISIQDNPSVAMDNNGNFVVAWSGEGDGDSSGVYAQRYDSSGNKLGAQFQVNSYTPNFQNLPVVAMNPESGDFVIAWRSRGQEGTGSNFGIFAKRYDNLGNELAPPLGEQGNGAGNEFQVNTYTANNQGSNAPSVAMGANGNFIIAWDGEGIGDPTGVFAQLYNHSGNKIGSEFKVNSYTAQFSSHLSPSTGMDSLGKFIIVWGGPGVGDTGGIFAQRYDSMGALVGSNFLVNTNTANLQSIPFVAMDANSNFVITWQSTSTVNAKVYSSNGSVLEDEFVVSNTGVPKSPKITMNAVAGSFVITYYSTSEAPDNVYARKYAYDTNAEAEDTDGDSVDDNEDNCLEDFNPDQLDSDSDLTGDVCDICPSDNTNSCDPDFSVGEFIIASEGGMVIVPTEEVYFEVPPGALKSDSSMSITKTTINDTYVILGDFEGKIVTQYSFTPNGIVFDIPVKITFEVECSFFCDLSEIWIFNDTNWERLETKVEKTVGSFYRYTAETTHFTIFALVTPLDSDIDGIINEHDLCEETPEGEIVNLDGCSCSQIEIPFRDCPTNHCTEEDLVFYPEDGYDLCEAGMIIQGYSCNQISSEYNLECDPDDDDDGVLDEHDLCPYTELPEIFESLKMWHYGDIDGDDIFETRSRHGRYLRDSWFDLEKTHGCSCRQILGIKPGKNNGEMKYGCSLGTLWIFIKKYAWARNF